MAADTLGHLLALHVTPASAEDRGEVERLARTVQAVTNDAVELAWVDQVYTGKRAANVSCPLLSGPSTMRVLIKEGTTNACEKAQAGRDHREAA